MENDLKDIWDQSNTEEMITLNYRDLGDQSKDLIHRIEKKLKLENAFNIVFTVALTIYLAITLEWAYLTLLLAIAAPITWYYALLIARISRQNYNEPVKEYLADIYGHLKQFLLHYKIVGPITTIAGIYIGMEAGGMELQLSDLATTKGIALFVINSFLGLGIAMVYIHFLYGKNIKKLQDMLTNLD